MAEDLREAALDYHRLPTPGKIAIQATKPLSNQRDLALAYSPGVAAACEMIVSDPAQARQLTSRGNLVGVITNGTAVLGLGAIGPLASKPVMEGKAVLFKKFAGIDVFDIEINETDPDRLVDVIAALEPTFGAINLEDIKAPECFEVEEKLRQRMKIPVFHDDQHGTAITVGAAVLNGLKVVGKEPSQVRLVTSGAGAAAIACLDLLVALGIRRENIWVTDIAGVVYAGRTELMDPRKGRYAQETSARSLSEVIAGADVFLGLSAPHVLKPDWCRLMAERPLILALANPTPEIMPEVAREVRPDAVIATGRSDYPNQVNNVLCFPFIFRGALDVGATSINEAMKLAAVRAIAGLAMAEGSDVVATAYGDQQMVFGPEYIIPRPFDPRLITVVAPAVAQAAMESGVAARPIASIAAYREALSQYVYRSGMMMRPMIARARQEPQRVAYAEGEKERVLRAVQAALDDGFVRPILIGRREVVAKRIERLGLRFRIGKEIDLVDPQKDSRYDQYWTAYHKIMERRGVSPDQARATVRTNSTVIGALMVHLSDADALICGTIGAFTRHANDVFDVIGLAPGVRTAAALIALITPRGVIFICDTHVSLDPSAEDIAEMTVRAAEEVERFGIHPKVALVSHSNFGTHNDGAAVKMREALALIRAREPSLEIDGEMHADSAISEEIRKEVFPDSTLKGQANILVMPDLDSANISYNLIKTIGDGQRIGPMLLGTALPVHILTPSVTVRGIYNMTAVACVDAQALRQRKHTSSAGAMI